MIGLGILRWKTLLLCRFRRLKSPRDVVENGMISPVSPPSPLQLSEKFIIGSEPIEKFITPD